MARIHEVEPQITKFYFSSHAWASLVMISFIVYSAVASFKPFPEAELPFFDLGRSFVDSVGGIDKFKYVVYSTPIIHVFEALYTWYVTRKHTSFFLCTIYVLTTVYIGYPIWLELNHRISQAKKGKLD